MHLKTILLAPVCGIALWVMPSRTSAALPTEELAPSAWSANALARDFASLASTSPSHAPVGDQATESAGQNLQHDSSLLAPLASSEDLTFPSFAYQRETILKKTSSSIMSEPTLAQPSTFVVRPQRRFIPNSGSRMMPIIEPKPGIDYKLTIVVADPQIDPKMLFPVERQAAASLAGR